MADNLSRAFRVQLTTAMETVIRTAVFEITQIFENSLHDHQVDLAQKGEEIAQLKTKLQNAEISLCKILSNGDVEMSQNHTHENQKESEKTQTPPEPSSAVPEIDFEVPDDWCVPLDSENVTKQEDFCPSVRLRKFSIPLRPISIPKKMQEKVYLNQEPRPKKRGRKPKEVTALDETSARTKDKSLPNVRRSQRGIVPVNNKVKNLLTDTEQKYSNSKVEPLAPRKSLTGKEQESYKIKTRRTDKTLNNDAGMTHPCKFCSKVFYTVSGLNVHIRSHKKCKGCKRVFPFPSTLQQHKANCSKYNNLMAVKSSNPQPSESITKEKSPSSEKDTPSCKQSTRIVKLTKMHKDSIKKNVDFSWTKPLEKVDESSSVSQKTASKTNVGGKHKRHKKKAWKSVAKRCPEGFKCRYCKNIFKSSNSVIEHAQSHTRERPFECDKCPAEFCHIGYLCVHKRRQHKHEKKRFTCACGKTFAKKSKYKDHKLNFHKV